MEISKYFSYTRQLIPTNSLNEFKENYKILIFYFGLFLLPTAFTISALLLVIASILGFHDREESFFTDKFNILFSISGLLMIISCIIQSIYQSNLEIPNWEPYLSWIGLGNFIPFFILTWGFQPYLDTLNKRKNFCFILLSGSFPILLTGIGQVFLNWHGPINGLFGLITWYSRPIENGAITGLTGLFNNANYTGAWLNIIFPIGFAFFIDSDSKFKKITSSFFIATIALCVALTNSRSAWIGLILSTQFFLGKKGLRLILIFLGAISTLLIVSILNEQLTLLPVQTIKKFTDFQYSRIDIWNKAINIIFQNPIFGTGASSFTEIYRNITSMYKGHSHNLVLELMISYGVPAALFTIVPIGLLLYSSYKKIIIKKLPKDFTFDKSLVIAILIIFITHMVDIQYFDGRFSVVLWLLIASLKNILNKNKDLYLENQTKNYN